MVLAIGEVALSTGLQGVKGAAAGALIGLGLGCASSIANMFLFKRETPLTYTRKGKTYTLKGFDTIKEMKIEEDLRDIMKHRKVLPFAYNNGCHLMQHSINLYTSFKQQRAAGKDGMQCIVKFQKAAIRVDTFFRALNQAIKDSGERLAAEENHQSILNIHFSLEQILHSMREEWRLEPQLPTKKPRKAK